MNGYNIRPTTSLNVGQTERMLSVAGGVLSLLWLLPRRSPLKLPGLMTSSYMVYRGVTGKCLVYDALDIQRTGANGSAGVRVRRAMTINRHRQDVYQFWRNFENLPRFMKHLERVQVTGPQRSHWTAKAPLGQTVEWEAEIIEDIPGEKISWRSLPGSQIENAGSVIFLDAPGGRGTEVQVTIQYDPPAGSAGAAVARLFGEEPSQQVLGDLRRFKQILETGEIATVEGQSSGRVDAVEEQRQQLANRLGVGGADPEGYRIAAKKAAVAAGKGDESL